MTIKSYATQSLGNPSPGIAGHKRTASDDEASQCVPQFGCMVLLNNLETDLGTLGNFYNISVTHANHRRKITIQPQQSKGEVDTQQQVAPAPPATAVEVIFAIWQKNFQTAEHYINNCTNLNQAVKFNAAYKPVADDDVFMYMFSPLPLLLKQINHYSSTSPIKKLRCQPIHL